MSIASDIRTDGYDVSYLIDLIECDEVEALRYLKKHRGQFLEELTVVRVASMHGQVYKSKRQVDLRETAMRNRIEDLEHQIRLLERKLDLIDPDRSKQKAISRRRAVTPMERIAELWRRNAGIRRQKQRH